MGRLGAYFPNFCNIVNMNGPSMETTNDPTDRIVLSGLEDSLALAIYVCASVLNFHCRLITFDWGAKTKRQSHVRVSLL